MSKTMKIVSILMMAIMLVMVATPVFAKVNVTDAIQNVDDAIDKPESEATSNVTATFGKVIGALQWIGAIAGILIVAIFGIKYMMGSLEEKAEYKKTMIPFIVGAVVLFAAPQIAKLIFNILT